MALSQTILLFLATYTGQVDPDLHRWFENLRSPDGGYCCAETDGVKVDDPSWGQDAQGYWVFIDGQKIRAPEGTIIYSRNPRVNYAIVWRRHDATGKPYVKCFLPGPAT